ncbi:MAG: hypothetical protein ACKVZJ_15085 [Phycisphaerales bacterium]
MQRFVNTFVIAAVLFWPCFGVVNMLVPRFGPSTWAINATGARLRSIGMWFSLYLRDFGAYPAATPDWAQHLVLKDGTTPGVPGESVNDHWDQPLIYAIPPGATVPVVRSIGENGIDNGGVGDDITLDLASNALSINDGFYTARYRGVLRSWATPVMAAFATWVALVVATPAMRRHAALLLAVPVFAGLVVYGRMKGYHTCRGYQEPWDASAAGCAALAFGLSWQFGTGLSSLLTLRPRLESECASCRYDLSGIAAEVCPECGTPVQPAPRSPP